jgi:hypothetical protein
MRNESRDPSLLAVGTLLLMAPLTKRGMGCCEGASASLRRALSSEFEEERTLELSRQFFLVKCVFARLKWQKDLEE